MSIVNAVPLLEAAGGDYTISRSVRLRSSASAYFNRTFGTGSTTQWTWSAWVKRGALGTNAYMFAPNNVSGEGIYFNSSNQFSIAINGAVLLASNAVYRDPSAWYHVVVASDMGNATAVLRCRVYINGVEITSWATDARASYSSWGSINSATNHNIGVSNANTIYFDGYITENNFVNAQVLTPSSFGQNDLLTGVWQPKKYVGTYGTNGFYLNFSDNSAATAAAIGKDYSGNGNNWTPNNISVTAGVTYDSMTDVPTLTSATAANYATFNPINTAVTLTNGNLDVASVSNSIYATQQVTSGKWYWEFTLNGTTSYNYVMGVSNSTGSAYVYMGMCNGGNSPNSFLVATSTNGTVTQPTGSRPSQPATIGIKLDISAGSVEFYINGTLNGSVTGITNWSSNDYWTPYLSSYTGTFTYQPVVVNFGQRPFSQTQPTGFLALNTYNLPTSTIVNGAQYMAATTYTGTGAALTINNGANTTIGTTFQPDFVWMKKRSSVGNNVLQDVVRGVNAQLFSNSTTSEQSGSTDITSFNSNGFTIAGTDTDTGANGSTYVGWQWKAAGSSVSNTSGTITSTVNAGTTQGFSVVTGTTPASGTFTVGHGLGVAPAMYIFKRRSNTSSWGVWHQSLSGGTYYLTLEGTGAQVSDSTVWTASPSSTVLNIGSAWTATGAQTFVAYCFAAVAGFSKFGSYTGNGSADGPFVYCGFRPRYVLIKRTDSTSDWYLMDTSRNTYNAANSTLAADLSLAESSFSSANYLDFLSNGFKIRQDNSSGYMNASGGTYIFAAFAENPTKYALAR